MQCNIDELKETLKKQLNNFYLITNEENVLLEKFIPIAFKRIEKCFSKISNKYYSIKNDENIDIRFNCLHQCQYAQFLYFISNSLWYGEHCEALCDKIYGINKIISACDMFYQVQLPDIFFFDHPIGSVLGRAEYSDFFSFSQGCTVGNNKGVYPKFEKRVFMLSDSKVIGDCHIGKNVIISANTYIKDMNIPDNSIVFGQSPDLIIKENNKKIIDNFACNMFRC